MTVKISTVAHIPDDLAHAWLQHMRDFDTAHPGCHFQVLCDAPSFELGQMIEVLNISPSMDVLEIFRRK